MSRDCLTPPRRQPSARRLQDEAPALGKPVLVLRDGTERQKGVAAGTARPVGTEPDRLVEQASALLSSPAEYALMARAVNPYGDGHAAERIVAGCRSLNSALRTGTRLASRHAVRVVPDSDGS